MASPSCQATEPNPSTVSSSSSPPPPNWGTHVMGTPAVPTCHPENQKSSSPPPPNWGTHVMGTPAVPTSHPDNQKAALQGGGGDGGGGAGDADHHGQYFQQPYVQHTPAHKPSNSPLESILHMFETWSKKAEATANNVWHNLRTSPSVSSAAWGKMNLTAKAITEGGFESLYKQAFTTFPNEKLKKCFACYLSTSTGPVAGTLYLSDAHVAFCSDCPLSFPAPSGQETWIYYKVLVPLGKIGAINPVVMRENQSEKYIQIVTIDGHDFWFMGFVNFDKASKHLSEGVSHFAAPGIAVPSPSS